MTINGKFVDSNGNGLNGVEVDFYPTGDMSSAPVYSDQSNTDGTYSFSNVVLDDPSCTFSISYPGYQQVVGQVGLLNGTVTLEKTTLTKMFSSIPWWVWPILVVGGYFAWKKFGHKLKF